MNETLDQARELLEKVTNEFFRSHDEASDHAYKTACAIYDLLWAAVYGPDVPSDRWTIGSC